MTANRSTEEYKMRAAIAAWGRERWPRARVVHELVVNSECRIDMAFIEPMCIHGVEIKSSRDKLDRLENQARVFGAHLPDTIVAVAPKWLDRHGYFAPPRGVTNWIICDGDHVSRGGYLSPARRDVTAQMLHLLWADEARAIAARRGLLFYRQLPLHTSVPLLARALTGDEIVREVCRELRARDAFPRLPDHPASDAPIHEAAV